jgi:hypothetical protein
MAGVALVAAALSISVPLGPNPVKDGAVTITLNANPVVLETSPFDNLAEWFGTPIAFNDDGVWLRKTVNRVAVVHANCNS